MGILGIISNFGEAEKLRGMQLTKSFGELRQLLAKYDCVLAKAVDKGGQADDVPCLMISEGLRFGQGTIKAIEVLLEKKIHSVFACALSRANYELAIRLLWAAREANGWERLQAYFANEDKKWAEEAITMPEVVDHAQKMLADSSEVLRRKFSNGKPYTVAPSVQQMLRDIERRDISDGIRPKGGSAAVYEYTGVYRIICRPAHAHIQAVSAPASAYLGPTVFATGLATFSLVRGVCYVGAKEPRKEIDAVGVEIADTMKGLFGEL